MKSFCYLTVFLISFYHSFGQTISNVKAKLEGNVIAVTYDLQADDLSHDVISINLYASHNNYQNPLENVRGDVGNNVSPGMNKKILWNYQSELGSFDDFINFKLISKMIFTFPTNGTALKRGKEYMIEWSGGGNNEKLSLELLKGGASIKKSDILTNEGEFEWVFPAKLTPGRNYQFRIINVNSPKEITTSESFRIKRKMPWGVRIPLAVIIGGGVATYIILQNGGSPPGTKEGTGLPGPPLPDDIIN